MASEKRGPGRPKTDTPNKDRRVTFRLDETAYTHLKDFSEKHEMSLADTINKGLELVYQSEEE